MSDRVNSAVFFALCILAAFLLPIFKVTYFNIDDVGAQYIDTVVFTLILSALAFVLALGIYSRYTEPVLQIIGCTLLLSSLLNTFFIPSSLEVTDGTDALSFVVREEAHYTIGIVFLLLTAIILGSKRFALPITENVFFALKIVISLAITLSAYTLIVLPEKISGIAEQMKAERDAPVIKLGPKNVLILSFDQLQGSALRGFLESERGLQRASELQGFRFFPNTVSTYPNTEYSLASTFLGRAVKGNPETKLSSLKSPESFLEAAKRQGFQTAYYNGGRSFFTTKSYTDRASSPRLLPLHALNVAFGAKLSTFVPTLNADIAKYHWKDDAGIYKTALADSLQFDKEGPNTLNYFHFLFSHQPFLVDSGCDTYAASVFADRQSIEGFMDTADCILLGLEHITSALKAMGVYDNTAIFITSDHGFESNINSPTNVDDYSEFFLASSAYRSWNNIKALGAYNPVLLYKGFNRSGELSTTEEFVSLIDLAPTVCGMIDCEIDEWSGDDLERGISSDRSHEFWVYHGGSDRFKDGPDRYHGFPPEHWKKVKVAGFSDVFEGFRRTLGEEFSELVACDTKLEFGSDASSRSIRQIRGISAIEHWGRWSDAPSAEMSFTLKKTCIPDALKFTLSAFVTEQHPEQQTSIYINNRLALEVNLRKGEALPKEVLVELGELPSRDVELRFEIDSPVSPESLGLSTDPRTLGIGFVAVEFIST